MSKAFYRKYRSKSLGEVVGQSHITDIISRALKEGKVAHAYLFTGPRGVGKTSIARILAHEINQLPYENDEPHLDIIEIDAASNNGVDDIRELRERVRIAPVSAKKKVYIIDEVHMLSKPAFNALLKTLEEPPEHVVFILATTDADKLPDTIISRTQRFSFRTISTKEVAGHLAWIAEQEGFLASDEALELIAIHGGGSFRDSISLLDQLHSAADEKTGITRELVESFLGIPSGDLITQLLAAHESGDLATIVRLLKDSDHAGTQPTIIADELIRAVSSGLATKPGLLPLLDKLLEVSQSSRPDIKLLVALSPVINKAPRSVALEAPRAVITAPVPKKGKEPVVEPTVEPQKEPVAAKPKPVANTAFNWHTLLDYAKANHVAIAAVLNKCSHDISGSDLVIYTGNSFYKNKLDTAKYRSKLVSSLDELGMGGLSITIVGSTAPPKDEVAATVAAIMGGGEEVAIEEGNGA